MVNDALLTLITSILGEGKKTSRGNYAFVCPFHTSNPPGKKNFEINLTTNKENQNPSHCWGCESKFKTIKSLFKKLNVPSEKLNELKLILNDTSVEFSIPENKIEILSLPKEFIPFIKLNNKDIMGKNALQYVKSRGLSNEDIIRYNVGYCNSGKYENMIIIPSYNKNGKLNYFSARSFIKDSNKKLNPSISRNIIPFELYINWNLPIILCEGMFDAISIKRNAIPLLGKNIQSELMKKIMSSNVDKIYIALDKDAQRQALKFCEELLKEGKEVYLVDLYDKDPNSLGFEHFTKLIQNTYPLTLMDLIEKKLSL